MNWTKWYIQYHYRRWPHFRNDYFMYQIHSCWWNMLPRFSYRINRFSFGNIVPLSLKNNFRLILCWKLRIVESIAAVFSTQAKFGAHNRFANCVNVLHTMCTRNENHSKWMIPFSTFSNNRKITASLRWHRFHRFHLAIVSNY